MTAGLQFALMILLVTTIWYAPFAARSIYHDHRLQFRLTTLMILTSIVALLVAMGTVYGRPAGTDPMFHGSLDLGNDR